MAREILFRGKRKDDKGWVTGDLRHGGYYNGDREICIMSLNSSIIINHPVYPETVGQFTGLTDKNGKKIFEGDIVNCYTFTGMNDYRRGVVHWNEMFCGWYGKESCSLLCGLGEIYEVIGNIHDPERLNGTEP